MIHDCSTHSSICYLDFIAIPHSSALNWHALNYRLAYTMTDTYSLMVLEQWSQTPWNLDKIKNTYQVWSLKNFIRIRQISTVNWRWCSNLIWKKYTLTAFRPQAQNYLMPKMNIFCTGNEHLHVFYDIHQTSYKLDDGIMFIFVSGNIGHYFWQKLYITAILYVQCLQINPHSDDNEMV